MSALDESKAREIAAHPERYVEDYWLTVEEARRSGPIYHEKPVPFLYVPKIFTRQDIHNFDEALKMIFKIVNHTIELYLKEPGVRSLFRFDSRLEELILSAAGGHGYQANVPMGRFDLFYYPDGSYKWCELNTDGSSAMNEEDKLTTILLSTLAMREIARDHSVKRFELFASWVREVKDIYREYLGATGRTPAQGDSADTSVAILDFKDKGNLLEFEIFKDYFSKAGFNCMIVDPRDLTYHQGSLFYHDYKIDIIYRRLVTSDLMERYQEVPALVEGILANQTCLIGLN